MSTQTKIADLAQEIISAAPSISFSDEGGRYSEEFVSLDRMSEMRYAISNCAAASFAVIESYQTTNNPLDLIGVYYDLNENGTAALGMRAHWAVVVDGQWVMDFTARQFDKSESYPLVCTVDEWKEKIDGHVSRLFQQAPGYVETGE